MRRVSGSVRIEYEDAPLRVTLEAPRLQPMYSPLDAALQRDPLPWRNVSHLVALVLVATDVMALLFARQVAVGTREILFGPMPMTAAFPAAAVMWVAIRFVMGVYPGYGLTGPEELRRSTTSTILAGLSHLTLLVASQHTYGSRFIAVGVWVALIPLSAILRDLMKRMLIGRRAYGDPVVVLGAGAAGCEAIREMRDNPDIGIVPVAAFDDDPAKHGKLVEGVPILGSIEHALEWRAPYAVRDAIIAMPNARPGRVSEIAQEIARRYRNVSVVSNQFGIGSLWTRSKNVGTCSLLELRHERFARSNLVMKRVFDIIAGIPLFLISVPVIGLFALMVKIISPGASAFYSQVRTGLNGKRIRMWKIRTMIPDADAQLSIYLDSNPGARNDWETHMKLRRDPRIIRFIGSFLRRSSLDELPQLWNVLRGEMSLVGPRPFPDYHLRKFSHEFRDLRTQVPPGITGYWQVTHRSSANLDQQQATDRYYIHNWNLWLDLWILFRTAGAVLRGEGAY